MVHKRKYRRYLDMYRNQHKQGGLLQMKYRYILYVGENAAEYQQHKNAPSNYE